MNIISRKEAAALGLKHFFTGKLCIRGHLEKRNTAGGQCLACERERDAKRLEYIKIRKKKRYAESPTVREKVRQQSAEQYQRYYLKPEVVERRKRYYQETKEHQVARAVANYKANSQIRNAAAQIRRRNNPIGFIARGLVSCACKRIQLEKTDRSETLNGYSKSVLKNHLEAKFKPGMTWQNWGEWHVDHIKPIAAFIREGITDLKIINALENLQPLWANENLSKGDKYEPS